MLQYFSGYMTSNLKTRTVYMLALFPLAAIACQLLSFANLSQPGSVLFQDDFSDTSSGWKQANLPEGVAVYQESAFRIKVNAPNTYLWSTPGLSFSDTRIEAVALKAGGTDNNAFGLMCRYREGDQFYAFLISSDGYYGVAKYQGSQLRMLGTQGMPPADAILQGNAANHLRADCAANVLVFYVNGVQVAAYQDNDFSSGDAGLIAGVLDAPATEIFFDNFSVQRP
jgi:hypothetical protein